VRDIAIKGRILFTHLPAADRRRLDLFCILLRMLRRESDHTKAGRRVIQKACLFINRCSCGYARDQLQQWMLEWLWLHGCTLPFSLHWPEREGNRRRLLSLCLASDRLPPVEALSWLTRKDISPASAVYWPRVWMEGTQALQANAERHPDILKTVPVCILAGTLAVEIRDLLMTDWQHRSVRVVFNQVYTLSRRTAGQRVSQLEQEWWERVARAFPSSKPVRHYRLPGSRMHLDIYWPEKRVGLEVQGIQHWRPVERFGGLAAFTRRQESDAAKRAWCRANDIHLVEVSEDTPLADTLSLLSKLSEPSPLLYTLSRP
jgi:hypothetical protein